MLTKSLNEGPYGQTGFANTIAQDGAGNIYLGIVESAVKAETKITLYPAQTTTANVRQTPIYLASSPTITTTPTGLACDAAGNLYVVDGSTISEYTLSGSTLTSVPGVTQLPAGATPTSIAIDGAGTTYVGGLAANNPFLFVKLAGGSAYAPVIVNGSPTTVPFSQISI